MSVLCPPWVAQLDNEACCGLGTVLSDSRRCAASRRCATPGVEKGSGNPIFVASAGAAITASHPGYQTEPRVDGYIDALPDWQQAICRQLRDLIHAADRELIETIKRTVQPYFVLEGNVCALLAAKDHVNLFLYDGGIVPDPERIVTAGHENKSARTISFYRGDSINEPALTAMLQQIIANNRAGGWRKLKARNTAR